MTWHWLFCDYGDWKFLDTRFNLQFRSCSICGNTQTRTISQTQAEKELDIFLKEGLKKPLKNSENI